MPADSKTLGNLPEPMPGPPPLLGSDSAAGSDSAGGGAGDTLAEASDVPRQIARSADGELPATGLAQAQSRAWARVIERLERWIHTTFTPRDQRRAPAVLTSLIVHTALFLLLALWTVAEQVGDPEAFDFQAVASRANRDEQRAEMVLASADAPPPPSVEATETLQPEIVEASTRPSQLAELLEVADATRHRSPPPTPLTALLEGIDTTVSASFVGTGVGGRQPEMRQQVALARGGTIESERAVEAALEWLAAHQTPSGAWSLIHDSGECNGRCRNNGCPDRFDAAATGLSLLAFLGAGYTHTDGKHRETVRRGVYFLLQIQEETPQGGSFLYQCERGMYNHGIAAFALCEAYQLTGDPDLKQPAQEAIEFILSSQSYQGGWGYLPKAPGDLTLTGWQVMALKSAVAAGLDVPPATVLKVDPFLDSQMEPEGFGYGYREPGVEPTCTAIGMLLRLFRGVTHSDPRILNGAAYLEKLGPSVEDMYFNYYASLTLFHLGGDFWQAWNPRVRELLINTQATQGHEAGSWYYENGYGRQGGRLYTTAMAAMTLEVYYRFSPIYQQADEPFEL